MVEEGKVQLSHRARMAGLIPDQLVVTEHEGATYIICNPIVGEQYIYDHFGNVIEVVPKRNVEMVWLQTMQGDSNYFTMPKTRLEIMCPWLLARISKDGEIVLGDLHSLDQFSGLENKVQDEEREIFEHTLTVGLRAMMGEK